MRKTSKVPGTFHIREGEEYFEDSQGPATLADPHFMRLEPLHFYALTAR